MGVAYDARAAEICPWDALRPIWLFQTSKARASADRRVRKPHVRALRDVSPTDLPELVRLLNCRSRIRGYGHVKEASTSKFYALWN